MQVVKVRSAHGVADGGGGSDSGQAMVQLMGAWDQLAQRLPQQQDPRRPDAPTSRGARVDSGAELLLSALKLAVGCLRGAPPAPDGRPAVSRALDLASALADTSAAGGAPLDAACIAAGIVAEAVGAQRLHMRTVDAKLGAGVAALVHDILQVRGAPDLAELYDDEAAG